MAAAASEAGGVVEGASARVVANTVVILLSFALAAWALATCRRANAKFEARENEVRGGGRFVTELQQDRPSPMCHTHRAPPPTPLHPTTSARHVMWSS